MIKLNQDSTQIELQQNVRSEHPNPRIAACTISSIIVKEKSIRSAPIDLITNTLKDGAKFGHPDQPDKYLEFLLRMLLFLPHQFRVEIINSCMEKICHLEEYQNAHVRMLEISRDLGFEYVNIIHQLGQCIGVTIWKDDMDRVIEGNLSMTETDNLFGLNHNPTSRMQLERRATSNKTSIKKESRVERIELAEDATPAQEQKEAGSNVAICETRDMHNPDSAHAFVSKIREELLSNKDSRNGQNLNCALDRLSAELYADDVHFVLELVQNADDNQYSDGVQPTLVFVLHPESIVVYVNESGFCPADIDSICSVGRSSKKKRRGFIGKKGIGFKSVFKITDTPEIHSGDYHIRFDCREDLGYIVPQWLSDADAHKDLDAGIDIVCTKVRDARLLNSTNREQVEEEKKEPNTLGEEFEYNFEDEFEENCPPFEWTTKFVLPLRYPKKEIRDQINSIDPSTILFLNKLQCVGVVDCIEGKAKIVQKVREGDFTDEKEEINTPVLYREHVTFGEARNNYLVVKNYIPNELDSSNTDLKEIAVAFLLDAQLVSPCYDSKQLPSVETIVPKHEKIFAFLPVCHANFRFILQGEFMLSSSRQSVINNAENQDLVQHFSELVMRAIMAFKDPPKNFDDTMLKHLSPGRRMSIAAKYIPKPDEILDPLFQTVERKIHSDLCRNDWIPTEMGEWVEPYRAMTMSRDLIDHMKRWSVYQDDDNDDETDSKDHCGDSDLQNYIPISSDILCAATGRVYCANDFDISPDLANRIDLHCFDEFDMESVLKHLINNPELVKDHFTPASVVRLLLAVHFLMEKSPKCRGKFIELLKEVPIFPVKNCFTEGEMMWLSLSSGSIFFPVDMEDIPTLRLQPHNQRNPQTQRYQHNQRNPHNQRYQHNHSSGGNNPEVLLFDMDKKLASVCLPLSFRDVKVLCVDEMLPGSTLKKLKKVILSILVSLDICHLRVESLLDCVIVPRMAQLKDRVVHLQQWCDWEQGSTFDESRSVKSFVESQGVQSLVEPEVAEEHMEHILFLALCLNRDRIIHENSLNSLNPLLSADVKKRIASCVCILTEDNIFVDSQKVDVHFSHFHQNPFNLTEFTRNISQGFWTFASKIYSDYLYCDSIQSTMREIEIQNSMKLLKQTLHQLCNVTDFLKVNSLKGTNRQEKDYDSFELRRLFSELKVPCMTSLFQGSNESKDEENESEERMDWQGHSKLLSSNATICLRALFDQMTKAYSKNTEMIETQWSSFESVMCESKNKNSTLLLLLRCSPWVEVSGKANVFTAPMCLWIRCKDVIDHLNWFAPYPAQLCTADPIIPNSDAVTFSKAIGMQSTVYSQILVNLLVGWSNERIDWFCPNEGYELAVNTDLNIFKGKDNIRFFTSKKHMKHVYKNISRELHFPRIPYVFIPDEKCDEDSRQPGHLYYPEELCLVDETEVLDHYPTTRIVSQHYQNFNFRIDIPSYPSYAIGFETLRLIPTMAANREVAVEHVWRLFSFYSEKYSKTDRKDHNYLKKHIQDNKRSQFLPLTNETWCQPEEAYIPDNEEIADMFRSSDLNIIEYSTEINNDKRKKEKISTLLVEMGCRRLSDYNFEFQVEKDSEIAISTLQIALSLSLVFFRRYIHTFGLKKPHNVIHSTHIGEIVIVANKVEKIITLDRHTEKSPVMVGLLNDSELAVSTEIKRPFTEVWDLLWMKMTNIDNSGKNAMIGVMTLISFDLMNICEKLEKRDVFGKWQLVGNLSDVLYSFERLEEDNRDTCSPFDGDGSTAVLDYLKSVVCSDAEYEAKESEKIQKIEQEKQKKQRRNRESDCGGDADLVFSIRHGNEEINKNEFPHMTNTIPVDMNNASMHSENIILINDTSEIPRPENVALDHPNGDMEHQHHFIHLQTHMEQSSAGPHCHQMESKEPSGNVDYMPFQRQNQILYNPNFRFDTSNLDSEFDFFSPLPPLFFREHVTTISFYVDVSMTSY